MGRNRRRSGFHDRRAGDYLAAMARCADARRAELEAFAAMLPISPGMLIADLAAGDGYLATHLAHAHPTANVVVVETSIELLEHVRQSGRVECVHVTNLCELPFQDGRFDAVVSLASLHHVVHKRRVFAEVVRLLRPGGCFVVGDVCDGTPTQAFFDNVCSRYCYTGHDFDFIDAGWLQHLAAHAGLELEVARVSDTPWTFTSKKLALEFVRGLLGLELELDVLEAKIREHFAIVEQEGAWTIGWQLGYFRLRKPG